MGHPGNDPEINNLWKTVLKTIVVVENPVEMLLKTLTTVENLVEILLKTISV